MRLLATSEASGQPTSSGLTRAPYSNLEGAVRSRFPPGSRGGQLTGQPVLLARFFVSNVIIWMHIHTDDLVADLVANVLAHSASQIFFNQSLVFAVATRQNFESQKQSLLDQKRFLVTVRDRSLCNFGFARTSATTLVTLPL